MITTVKRIDPATLNLKEQVVAINRVTKVVKGGKNLSFSALVVIGDPVGEGGGLRRGQGEGSAVGDPQGHRSGQEEPAPGATSSTPRSRTRCWAASPARRCC